jgi:predicted transcriptional regulator
MLKLHDFCNRADIVAAHVSNNTVSVGDVSQLITNVHAALNGLSTPIESEVARPKPAVPIRASIKPDYIVCLEDGKKLKMLKRHLMACYQMTPGGLSREMGSTAGLSHDCAQLYRTT